MKKEINDSWNVDVEATYLRTEETGDSPADMSPGTVVDSVASSLPTFIATGVDNVQGVPGAFRIGGRPASTHDSDTVSSQRDDTQSAPIFSGEIASGAEQSELRQLRNAFANVPRAQRLFLGEENRNNIEYNHGSPHSCVPPKKQMSICGSVCAGLVILALVIGITLGLQKTNENSSTVSLVPKNSTSSPAPTTSPSVGTTSEESEMPLPTLAPSSSPIGPELCFLGVYFACSISLSGRMSTCEDFRFPDLSFQAEPCHYTPFRAGLLYNGGNCSQSDSGLNFTCSDTALGPPTEEGTRSYIVVTDASGEGFIYFEGSVKVGDPYYIQSPEGKLLDDGFHIMIYELSDKQEPSTLLQEVTYIGTLCSGIEEWFFRFGASQLIEYENEVQGKVTSFASSAASPEIVFSFSIHRLDSRPYPLTLQNFTALTSFAGFLDFTDQVTGMKVQPENLTMIDIPVELDLTMRTRYNILTRVTAIEDVTGNVCIETDFYSFYAGGMNPVPTSSPTVSPTFDHQ